MTTETIPIQVRERLRRGTVIPAHPLALTPERTLDERRQRALTRYYMDAGAGGIAVGVHTTQFEIRAPEINLFESVLRLCTETMDYWNAEAAARMVRIAGVCGRTAQATSEAIAARKLGYHAALLSLASWPHDPIDSLIAHCKTIAEILPLIGFYLQPAVGGRTPPYEFWRKFADIPNVIAVKMAPFNRYQTLEVIRAIADADRLQDIALYTGNDDHILIDLLTEYRIQTRHGTRTARIVGGLLGHWSVWTRRAVELLDAVHEQVATHTPIPSAWLTKAAAITDCNAAFFDAANTFAGCMPGLHEVLRRQGLLAGIWCLDAHLNLLTRSDTGDRPGLHSLSRPE